MPIETKDLTRKGPMGAQIFDLDEIEKDLRELFSLEVVRSQWGRFDVIRKDSRGQIWIVHVNDETMPLAKISEDSRWIMDANVRRLLRSPDLTYTEKVRPYFVREDESV